jgi:hypothetical protein
MMTTVVTSGESLCVYRSSEMPAELGQLEPHAMLEEVFPAVAYYQDTWGSTIDRARISGFGDKESAFGNALASELQIATAPIGASEAATALDSSAKDIVSHDLDALAGWNLNGRR